MESLCFLKTTSSFPLSTPDVSVLGKLSYTVDHHIMETAKQSLQLKRPASAGTRELPTTPCKHTCLDTTDKLVSLKHLHCASSYDSKSIKPNSDKMPDTGTVSEGSEKESLKVEISETGEKNIVVEENSSASAEMRQTESKFAQSSPEFKHLVPLPGVSVHGTGLSESCSYDKMPFQQNRGEEHFISETPNGTDPRIKRCRSLPCRIKHETKKEEKCRSFFVSNPSSIDQSDIGCWQGEDNNNSCEECDSDLIAEKNVNEENIDSDNKDCHSFPPTPSSGYVDIEADTPPSSPLNLTTNPNHETESVANKRDSHSEKTIWYKTSETSTLLNVVTCTDTDERTQEICNLKASPEKANEKTIKFSIDAILSSDFGAAVNSNSQIQKSFQRNHTPNLSNPRIVNSIRSSHSAFTAVDLSTRSRSDSLSSSSCSSSSPSPPLSTPSPRHKAEFSSSTLYEKQLLGQENNLFPTRLFPHSTRDLEHIIAGTFPFMKPIPGSVPLAKFPFLPSSQVAPYYKVSSDKELFKRHQQTPDFTNSKTVYSAHMDVSKLFARSIYPFASNKQEQHLQKDSVKQSSDRAHHQTKDGTAIMQTVLCHGKSSLLCNDAVPLTKRVGPPQDNELTTLSLKKKSTNPNSESSVQDSSQNVKPTSKHEKMGQAETKVTDSSKPADKGKNPLWPAWVFCTRYSDRPSSGPRSRKTKRSKTQEEKRPRTAFTNDQLQRLKREFEDCRYLTEVRRKNLADELGLTESQIKIWFQNKRAKIKKSVGVRNPLALKLMEQGLYNHSTVKPGEDDYLEDAEDN